MTFPIHMDDLGPFVAALRSEGFDARADLFNGQVGLIVGPNGLDPNRMPPDTAGLFFPLWELNYTPNRALVEARRFHDIFENRSPDWQLNRPYQHNAEHERLSLRHWNRSASLLGKSLEGSIQQELIRRFPPNEFPVNIDVIGGQAQTFATVHLTNFEAGINETKRAFPEDFLGRGGRLAAVIEAIESILIELQRIGRIPTAPHRRPSHGDVNLFLHAIAHAGHGSDVTQWDRVIQYEVRGLPPGERAWIGNFGGHLQASWRILRAHHEVQSDWTGDYDSPKTALEVLQKEFDVQK